MIYEEDRMRILTALLILICCWGIGVGQEVSCPSVSVFGPSTISLPRQTEQYSVRVEPAPATPLTFKWTTSSGTITSGQGTKTITVEEGASCLTVTVEIFGLPTSCPSIVSESSCIDPVSPPIKLDEIVGPITKRNDKQLKKIVEAAINAPNNQLYIVIYGRSATKRRDQMIAKLNRLFRQEDQTRTTFVYSASKVDKIVIWSVPPGATPPMP